MKLGNFFDAVGTDAVAPVNPRPVEICLVSEGDKLPNGKDNPGGRPIRARGPAAIVALTGPEMIAAMLEAPKLVASIAAKMEKDPDDKEAPVARSVSAENIATGYAQLAIYVREWDQERQTLGARLFSSTELAMKLVPWHEAARLARLYDEYEKDEHPSKANEVDPATRSKSEGRGARPSAGPPR